MEQANGQGHWTYCNPSVFQTLLTVTVTKPYCFRTAQVYCVQGLLRTKAAILRCDG